MRRRVLAAAVLALLAAAAAALLQAPGGARGRRPAPVAVGPGRALPRAPIPPPALAVGIRVMKFVDQTRTVELPTGPAPRTLVTFVRYPALGSASGADVPNAPAARSGGPYPLVVFGHGFAVTPGLYARLLRAWTKAGYVVAAPVFPKESADAPGGPDESDLTNQPGDMQFVISELLALSAAGSGPLAGLIDPTQIAVAGQSDGGDTALAVAYNSTFRDPRVKAAIILSGAEINGVEGYAFGPGEPPLLATQGTADKVNPPSATSAFFTAASAPKFLLNLLGAEHIPPYSSEEPQLGIVERVSVSFLDAYLKGQTGALKTLQREGDVAGKASIVADP